MKITKEFLLEKNKFLNTLATIGMGLASAGVAAKLGSDIYKGNIQNNVTAVEKSPESVTAASSPKVKVTDEKNNVKTTADEKIYHHEVIKSRIQKDEGIRTKMYKDTEGIKTVGIGHNLENTKQSSASFSKAFGDSGSSIRSHVLGGGSLSSDQAKKLFDSDYQEHLDRTVKLIPNLHKQPPDVQAVLVSGVYRGHVSGSPKFRKLFNAENYGAAAAEFKDSREYKTGVPGVKDRLAREYQVLKSHAESVQKQSK